MINAVVVVRFRISNICDERDLEQRSLEDIVRKLIDDEGLIGVVDDDSIIVSVIGEPSKNSR